MKPLPKTLKGYVRRFCVVKLNRIGAVNYKEVRGYYWRQNGQDAISITRGKLSHPEEAAVLIHEFGHSIAQRLIGKMHTEADAWQLGYFHTPIQYRPANFQKVMKDRLSTYVESEHTISPLCQEILSMPLPVLPKHE